MRRRPKLSWSRFLPDGILVVRPKQSKEGTVFWASVPLNQWHDLLLLLIIYSCRSSSNSKVEHSNGAASFHRSESTSCRRQHWQRSGGKGRGKKGREVEIEGGDGGVRGGVLLISPLHSPILQWIAAVAADKKTECFFFCLLLLGWLSAVRCPVGGVITTREGKKRRRRTETGRRRRREAEMASRGKGEVEEERMEERTEETRRTNS